MLLSRDKSQLLIIDVQEKLLPAMSNPERVVERCVRLVRAARTLEIPITVSEQYPGGIGPTAIDLEDQGFEAFVTADATSSRAKSSSRLALARLAKSGVDVVDSEMVVFEWLGRASTPEFKELLALVK